MNGFNTLAAIAQGGAQIISQGLGRFIPEPRNGVAAPFKSMLSSVATSVAGGTVFPGVEAGYTDLLNQQMEMQQQMQLVSLYSNIEKSRHETQMAAVRNIRAG
jgi:hypothetical protein